MQGTAIHTLPLAKWPRPLGGTPAELITPDGEADQDQIGRTPKAPKRK